MNELTKFFKNNPIKVITFLIAFIGSIISSIWMIEDRYVLKKELEATKASLQKEREIGYSQLKDLIIMQYEDKIQELNFKKNKSGLTPFEQTHLESLKLRINFVNEKHNHE